MGFSVWKIHANPGLEEIFRRNVANSFSDCELVSPDDRVTNLLVFQLVEITQVSPLPVQSSGESLESRPGKLPHGRHACPAKSAMSGQPVMWWLGLFSPW